MTVSEMGPTDLKAPGPILNLIGDDAGPDSSTVDEFWYVAHTKVHQEQVACENLARQGYAVYLPRIRVLKRSSRHRCQEMHLEPLFPRYLFFQPASTDHSIAPVVPWGLRPLCALARLSLFCGMRF